MNATTTSYGHTYLTSYGWQGTGTGLRKGAIDRPLAIPPKKNLSGLGKDRDEAFPFWDHLFAAASKAITIRVSSDDDDNDNDNDETKDSDSDSDSSSTPFRRTSTGILSNRRPVSGTPAAVTSTSSGSTTPDTATRPSLLAIAKREAAKRGLYARFYRGPVLGSNGSEVSSELPSSRSSGEPEAEITSTAFTSSAVSVPVPDSGGDREEGKESKKRKSRDEGETKEQRRERKRLKRELKAARAAKKAEKALNKDKKKKKKERVDDVDRKSRKQCNEKTHSEDETPCPAKVRKHCRKSVGVDGGDILEPEECTRKRPEKLASANCRPQETLWGTDACNLATKKKKGRRKDTQY